MKNWRLRLTRARIGCTQTKEIKQVILPNKHHERRKFNSPIKISAKEFLMRRRMVEDFIDAIGKGVERASSMIEAHTVGKSTDFE